MSGHFRALSPRQVTAVRFLLSGCSLVETARKTGCNEKTIRRWLESDSFTQALKVGESRVLERVSLRLVGVAEKAVGVLSELLEHPEQPGAGVRRLVAGNLLELCARWRELNDIETRLQALEKKAGC